MHDFRVSIELDSPLLLGGSRAGRVDSAGLIRPASVRGLMHTFARALFGPLLAGHGPGTRDEERRLLGAQGGVKVNGQEPGSTFQIEVEPHQLKSNTYLNCPHESAKGSRSGFDEAQTAALIVRPRPSAVQADPDLPAMLRVVLWTGLAFGALGNRSRRGYGSLTVTGMAGADGNAAPSLGVLLRNAGQGVENELPTWPTLPADEAVLAQALCRGLKTAQAAARKWLGVTAPLATLTTMPRFFQLFGPDWVYVGRTFVSSKEAMSTLMSACSRALGHNSSLYRTAQGWVPVATFSGDPGNRTAVDQVLQAIGAIDASGNYQTLGAVAGGGC